MTVISVLIRLDSDFAVEKQVIEQYLALPRSRKQEYMRQLIKAGFLAAVVREDSSAIPQVEGIIQEVAGVPRAAASPVERNEAQEVGVPPANATTTTESPSLEPDGEPPKVKSGSVLLGMLGSKKQV